ncbi:MAG: 1-phosphofructokinase family hexose kinase [Chloroflexi bacterium]|nr:1-phosphofructokinase family hexose kinase [Chloroflexota bacterium]
MIVTLTMNPAIDTSSGVDHVIADRKLRCSAPGYDPGGGGLNVSRAIMELGGDSLAIYPSGGWLGKMLEGLIDKEGLNHRSIPIEKSTRENLNFFEKISGRQFRFGMPGPELKEEEWKRCLDALRAVEPKPDYIVASGSLPPGVPVNFYALAADIARELGSKLIVDTSGDELRIAANAGVYLLKPNIAEFQTLVGEEIKNEKRQMELARKIIASGKTEVLVISMGVAGALLVTKDIYEHIRAPIVPIESRVGAGDSMVAGIVFGLESGKPLRDAVRFGVATGAAAVMSPGTGLCCKGVAEEIYARMASQNF